MKKKLLAFILVIVMCLSLAACSDDDDSYSSSGSKCQYKVNGKEVCNSKAQSGSSYCSYHTKYLNDAYNSLFGY